MPAVVGGSRFLETEFEDASKRLDFKRQRQLQTTRQREAGRSDCEQCLEECGCCLHGRCMGCCLGCPKKRRRRSSQEAAPSHPTTTLKRPPRWSMLLYSLLPAVAVGDFVLARLAAKQGWYERGLGDALCHWSPTGCAVWIAIMLSGVCVATFATCSAAVGSVRTCLRFGRVQVKGSSGGFREEGCSSTNAVRGVSGSTSEPNANSANNESSDGGECRPSKETYEIV